jgi:hypothetical protein
MWAEDLVVGSPGKTLPGDGSLARLLDRRIVFYCLERHTRLMAPFSAHNLTSVRCCADGTLQGSLFGVLYPRHKPFL